MLSSVIAGSKDFWVISRLGALSIRMALGGPGAVAVLPEGAMVASSVSSVDLS